MPVQKKSGNLLNAPRMWYCFMDAERYIPSLIPATEISVKCISLGSGEQQR